MRVIVIDPGRTEPRDVVRNLVFHPTGTRLAAVVGEPDHFRDMCWYDLARDRPLPGVQPADDMSEFTPLENGPDPVVSRDLELVAVGALNYRGFPVVGVVDTWAAERPEMWFESPAELVTFPALAFAADNSIFYAATTDADRHGPLVRAWNLAALFEDDTADAELDPFQRPGELAVADVPTALATDPVDQFLAVGTDEGAVWLFDPRREKLPLKLAQVRGPVRSIASTPDGRALVVTHAGVTLWDVRPAGRIGDWRGAYTAAAVSPDGSRLALVDAAGTLAHFGLPTGGELGRYNAGYGPLSAVAFAPDGLTCAVGGRGGQVVVWDG